MKTLEKLRQYLSSTTKEQFDDHWKLVEGVGVTGVTISEFESHFEFQPKSINRPNLFDSLVSASYGVERVECYSQAA
tara:strand:+ start:1735 stop:1965 length:231 start_codon:yes stop_codon:yes gene_type:complete